ncbi:transient receptor potential cation channel subfamily M member-like 2 [Corticium candelabrum]|uniref:transient receptor potential cation channel subfamily M member-like 2 n=1 Tax=Corticium candelabrum TaxID=121492 RepID=UPI002E2F5804|nr:transient receptor potential cation channel subfamily M member-like 2 [Corticium candelabrum]
MTYWRYVRLADNSDCNKVIEILIKEWEIPEPKFVISVTGGARTFRFDSQLKDVFARGLRKMCQDSGAWVMTGGEHSGVMKLVGKALLSNAGTESCQSITCIGICTWGRVYNLTKLIGDHDCENDAVEYNSLEKTGNSNVKSLDPNHSYFLLVDDGTMRLERTHQEWHSGFNQAIRKYNFSHENRVPVVTCLLNGGPDSLTTVRESLKQEIPVIIIKGTGRCADVIAFAISRAKRKVQPGGQKYEFTWADDNWRDLENYTKEVFTDSEFKEAGNQTFVTEITSLVEEGLQAKNNELLIVFDPLDSSMSPSLRQLDYVILMQLFRLSHKRERALKESVKLAMVWNRADIVRDEFLSQGINTDTLEYADWEELLTKALGNDDHYRFVQLFLDEGVIDFEKFVENRLTELTANSISNPSSDLASQNIFVYVKQHILGTTKLTDVDTTTDGILSDLFGHSLKANKCLTSGTKKLFLWALLTQHWKLAEVFWTACRNPIAAALAASIIIKSTARLLKGGALRVQAWDTLNEQQEMWAERAEKLMSVCYSQDPNMTQSLIMKPSAEWSSVSAVTLAAEARNLKFVAHECVQTIVNKKWIGDMKPMTSRIKIVSCVLLPLLIPFLIKKKDKSSGGISFTAFYSSPIVKFWLYLLFYVIFISIFSYSMLVRWQQGEFTSADGLSLVWVLSIFFEDLRQLFQWVYIVRIKTKILVLSLPSLSVVTKVSAFLLYIVGFGLRFFMSHDEADGYPIGFRWARMLLSISVCLYFARGMELARVNSTMGPRLTMIYKMIIDVVLFVGLLLVCLVAYGIATEMLLFPHQERSFDILFKIFYIPYWQIYGNLFLEEYNGGVEGTCVKLSSFASLNQTIQVPDNVCPEKEPLAFILFAFYLVLTNILLLNLLIAIFNNTFNKVQSDAESLWKFQWLEVVQSFEDRTWLPPPFNLPELIFRSVMFVYEYKQRKSKRGGYDQSDGRAGYSGTFDAFCMQRYLLEAGSESRDDA